MIVLFLVFMPLKYLILYVSGIETTGKIISLSTMCEHNSPIEPQPRVTSIYFIGEKRHTILGKAGNVDSSFVNFPLVVV
ncbi:MAG: hypothetical protein JWM78_582 [Verrucomicrobiaceae bacterium]|nr:hypothetical protein [Verrucomicrobiaceae bacterium]